MIPLTKVVYDGLQEGNLVKTLPEHLSHGGDKAETVPSKTAGRRTRIRE